MDHQNQVQVIKATINQIHEVLLSAVAYSKIQIEKITIDADNTCVEYRELDSESIFTKTLEVPTPTLDT